MNPATIPEAFARMDRATAAFAQASGLACPPGCGACCLSPEVESSVDELGPMAAHLCETGRAEAVLEALAHAGSPASCVLYQPEPGNPGRGRCGAYAHRPPLCRLFGFAAVRDKTGRPRLALCRVHRESAPETAERAARGVEEETCPAPFFVEHTAPGPRQPINHALREALEKELLRRALGSSGQNASG